MMSSSSPKERLIEFTRLYAAGDYGAALALVDALLAEFPNEGPLHWQRARTLEKLERYDEARVAVKRVLELRKEFAPAWTLRAELGDDDAEYDPEPDLRRAIALDPKFGRARYLLAILLNSFGGDKVDESKAQLDQAIALDPTLHEAVAARAGWSRVEAWTDQPKEGADGPEVINTFMGVRFKRVHVEDALADFDRAIAITAVPSYRFARADLLHQLRRHDEALAELDRLLAEIPKDDPLRELAIEARQKSANQGSGERVADGMHAGPRVPPTMEAEDAAPDYVATDAREYPRHQRVFEAAASKQLAKLGFEKIGDFDPAHLTVTLARKQLLSLYVRPEGHVTAFVFSIRPRWPGFLGWLVMVFKRLYRTANVIELETAFSDGTVLSTHNAGGLAPWGHGSHFLQEKLPPGTSAARLLEAHEARVEAHWAAHPKLHQRVIRTLDDVKLMAGEPA